jgi:Flp pilus assembly protein TadD
MIAAAFGHRIAAGLGAAMLAILVIATSFHAAAYRSEEALWRAAIAAQPQAWYPYHGLGTALLNEGNDAAAAVPWLEQAAAMHGTHPVTWFNLGLALVESGRADEARASLARAVALEPKYTLAQRVLEELDRRQSIFFATPLID